AMKAVLVDPTGTVLTPPGTINVAKAIGGAVTFDGTNYVVATYASTAAALYTYRVTPAGVVLSGPATVDPAITTSSNPPVGVGLGVGAGESLLTFAKSSPPGGFGSFVSAAGVATGSDFPFAVSAN